MRELLFNNIIEKEALENILALNQIKKCDNEIDKYTNEINEQTEEMTRILRDEGIEENYVEKIYKYKSLLNNMDGDNGRISELDNIIEENENRINDFQERINEIELKLEELKKEIFETDEPSRVIECQNEIESNNVRLNDLNEILNQLISDNTPLLIEKEYLLAKNNNFDFNIPTYNKKEICADLEDVTKEFEIRIEELDLPVRENIEFCQKKIKNREIEISKLTERKNAVIEMYPNSVELDLNQAYKDIEELLSDLELNKDTLEVPNNNIFDYEEPEQIKEIEDSEPEETEIDEKPVEIKDEMAELIDEEEITVDEPETVEETRTIEEEIPEETVENIEDNQDDSTEEESENEKVEEEEIGSVSYVLSDGESLMNIAEKVYPSKDNWEAIYYFNKESIDNYLVSNGISNDFDTIKELANDTSLFAGIQLEIPTDYNYKI